NIKIACFKFIEDNTVYYFTLWIIVFIKCSKNDNDSSEHMYVPFKKCCKKYLYIISFNVRKIRSQENSQDDEGVQGEKVVDLDAALKSKHNLFPTLESDNMMFAGKLYKNLPICNIRVSPNNTVLTLTDAAGVVKIIKSCGIEGFKNTKKGTNIAAQTTAISLANKAIDRGFKTVRVKVRGLGPGRLAAVKGLQMGGLDIVSVSDNTHVSWNPPRPRKARRL
ncbi:hypothetical protein ACJJTC_015538, partial [Scirpophaga incertulas]